MSEKRDYFDEDYIPDDTTPTADQIALARKAEAEEREMKELERVTIEMRHNWVRNTAVAAAVLVVAILGVWIGMRYWNPVVSMAQMTGFVTEIRCEGYIFKTYEGELLTHGFLYDSIAAPQVTVEFSVESGELARQLMQERQSGNRVAITYKQYSGSLPWRGASTRIVTAIDLRPQQP